MLDPTSWQSRLADPADRARWAVLAVALRSSVEELPAGVRTLVRFLRNDELAVAEAVTLPPALAQEWMVRRGDELIKLGRAAEALALFSAGRSRYRMEEPPWLAQAYCEDGRWSEYWSVVEQPDVANRDAARRSLQRSGRYAALNALCSYDPAHWMSFCRQLATLVEPGPPFDLSPADLSERAFLELLSATAVPGTPQFRPGLPLDVLSLVPEAAVIAAKPVDAMFPVDQLRRMQVWLAARSSRPFTLTRLARLLRPDPLWVEQFATLVGLAPTRLDEHLHHLRELANEAKAGSTLPSIDMLLGETNLQFVRLTADRIDVQPEFVRDNVALLHVLRGDNPELRPAIAQVLTNAVGPDGPSLLAALAQSALPIPVGDLEPDTLPPAGDPRIGSVLTQLVHIVDRAGVLVPFLTAAAGQLPRVEPLHRVLRAVRTWDAAQNRLLAALAAPLG